MEDEQKSFRAQVYSVLNRYSILIAGVVIYGYFLLTSMNILERHNIARSLFDVVFQFDSLMVMWIIAAVVIQLQRYRKQAEAQEEYRRSIQLEFERQRTQLRVVDEITHLLHDSINNPLAIISVTSQNLRRKFENEPETTSLLDRIDTALQRVHKTINDIKAYQTQRIVEDSPFIKGEEPRGGDGSG